MNEYDLVYAAGFFDGEGCVNIGQGLRTGHRSLEYKGRVEVAQSGIEGKKICEWFKSNFEGFVLCQKRKKYSYKWIVAHQLAYVFLKQVFPYLKIKRKQVEVFFEFQEKCHSYKRKSHPSEFDKVEKYSYYETAKHEIMFLNSL